MCRLLGYATTAPTSLLELLGDDDLTAFTELSRKHGDGWGLASSGPGGVELHKAPDAAYASPRFAEVARECPTDLALVHLRWATLGLAVVEDNAHPFSDGRLAFAHNGSVTPPAFLSDLVADRVRPLQRGDTDSELLFLAVLSRLPDGPVTDDAVALAYAQTLCAVHEVLPGCSLNSLVLTPTRLLAGCRHDPFGQEDGDVDYYRLGWQATGSTVVVASSGWGSGWTDLPNGHLLEVDRGTLSTRVRSLQEAAGGAEGIGDTAVA